MLDNLVGIKIESHIHLIVVACGCLGLFLGNFLIDLDHSGSIKDKWTCFLNPQCTELSGMERGILHNPKVAFSIITFLFCLALGYLIHILMDLRWSVIMP